MARRPFFSGNYGSALGSFDTAAKLIAQAGQTQGQAMANIGSQVGGMIEQYGLNKEKQKKADARIKSALNSMGEFVEAGVLSPENKTRAEEFLNDPNRSSAEKVVFIEEQEKMFFQVPKAQLAKSQALNAKLEADFAKATEQNRLLRDDLETEAQNTLNKHRVLQLEIMGMERDLLSDKRDVNRDLLSAELGFKRKELESLQEDILGKRNKNKIFDEELERERTKYALDVSEATSRLAINAQQIAQIEENKEIDFQTKQARLNLLEAQRKEIESELQQAQAISSSFSNLVGETDDTRKESDLLLPIDIDVAFQKDLPGKIMKGIGAIGGFFGQDITPETTAQAQNLKTLESLLLPAMTKLISSRPSNFNLQLAKDRIPNPDTDNDAEGRRKIESLIPVLKGRLEEAASTIKSGSVDPSVRKLEYFREAVDQFKKLPQIISVLEKSLTSGDQEISEEEILKRY
tara:strand:+ start:326 stop:1711 length:1386 start_codon:yes stop_codon:yes gene_type:complete